MFTIQMKKMGTFEQTLKCAFKDINFWVPFYKWGSWSSEGKWFEVRDCWSQNSAPSWSLSSWVFIWKTMLLLPNGLIGRLITSNMCQALLTEGHLNAPSIWSRDLAAPFWLYKGWGIGSLPEANQHMMQLIWAGTSHDYTTESSDNSETVDCSLHVHLKTITTRQRNTALRIQFKENSCCFAL